MDEITFGTDGWRAIIDKDYTVDNVARVATGTAIWLNKNYEHPTVTLGHDTRSGGELYAEAVARVLCAHKIKVFLAKEFVSTPMVCLGILKFETNIGIVITASHNPPTYNGFKLKGDFGGPLYPEHISEVESLIPDAGQVPDETIEAYEKMGMVQYVDLEGEYCQAIQQEFDLKAIHESGIVLGYDAMYGAGQNVIKKLFPDAKLLHCENDPSFKGQAPEPISKNLSALSALIKDSDISFGLATDGDADRIGICDHEGNFIDSHHTILLMIHYLHKYKQIKGKVVVAFSTSVKIKKLCEAYGIPYEVTKIGFKYIGSKMVDEDVLLGGEESGGIAIKGHLPERDGIWSGIVLLEFMAKTGKTIPELIHEIYDIVSPFAYDRNDLHIDNDLKLSIIADCKNDKFDNFGQFKVKSVEKIDGYKYFLEDDASVMIRPSGTEPVLRIYAEAIDKASVNEILEATTSTLLEKS